MSCLLVCQIYRYRRTSSPVQRQQTKWIVFTFAAIITIELAFTIPAFLFPLLTQPDSLYTLFFANFDILLLSLGPVGMSIAVVRYRLWDIDVIINRGLIYGTLTVLLALIYFGSIILIQGLIHVLAGPTANSNVALIISTLLSAALFQPLRQRIQVVIDRRFYRSKYDAGRILSTFGDTLRNEVDLEQLCTHLVTVVDETMRPRYISLWILPQKPQERTS